MDINQLEKAGLKEKEAKVYLSSLKEGPSLANHLAKTTEILRSSIYDYLDILLKKGFISYTIISGKKYFQAVDPKKILDNFQEQKEREQEALKQIIPALESIKNSAEKQAKVEVFEGKEGMKSAMSYILKNKPKEVLVYGSSGVSYKSIPFFMENFHRQRVKQKIKMRAIYNDTRETRERLKNGPPLKLASVKISPIKNFSLTGTLIYNDCVLITMWNPESLLAISIKSKEISKDYKDNFEALWKIAKK